MTDQNSTYFILNFPKGDVQPSISYFLEKKFPMDQISETAQLPPPVSLSHNATDIADHLTVVNRFKIQQHSSLTHVMSLTAAANYFSD